MLKIAPEPRAARPKLGFRAILLATTALCFLPLMLVVSELASGTLSFNPLQEATFRTGNTAITLLLLSLACTPAHTVFGWRTPLKLRKWLGLYAFTYALVHFSIFSLDHGYIEGAIDLGAVIGVTIEKRYALIGALALLILLPLALTSTKGWQRRLGRAWKRLHRFVYAAAVFAVVHWIWLVKSDTREPLFYGSVLAVLLVLRVPWVKRRVVALRSLVITSSKPLRVPLDTDAKHP